MASNGSLLQSAGLGAITGLRSMSGMAMLARRLQQRPPQQWPHPLLQRLAREPFASLTALLAAGEMAADKLPFIPARTDPLPLTGRAVLGAAVGAAAGLLEEQPWWAGAIFGSAAAVATAFAGYHARRLLTGEDGLPDPIVAVLEDGLVLGLGRRLLL